MNRFRCVTIKEKSADGMRKANIHIDYDSDGEIHGCMASSGKAGSETQAVCIDALTGWSRAIQDGADPESFSGMVTRNDQNEGISILSLAADVLLAESRWLYD